MHLFRSLPVHAPFYSLFYSLYFTVIEHFYSLIFTFSLALSIPYFKLLLAFLAVQEW